MKSVAVGGAGCGNSRCLVIVAKRIDLVGNHGVLAPLTYLGGVAVGGTGRLGYCACVGVSLLCKYSLVGCLTC